MRHTRMSFGGWLRRRQIMMPWSERWKNDDDEASRTGGSSYSSFFSSTSACSSVFRRRKKKQHLSAFSCPLLIPKKNIKPSPASFSVPLFSAFYQPPEIKIYRQRRSESENTTRSPVRVADSETRFFKCFFFGCSLKESISRRHKLIRSWLRASLHQQQHELTLLYLLILRALYPVQCYCLKTTTISRNEKTSKEKRRENPFLLTF